MAEYFVIFPVFKRMLDNFSKEEIELAARVVFYQHPPTQCRVLTAPSDLTLHWAGDYIRPEENKLMRVSGQVDDDHEAQQWTTYIIGGDALCLNTLLIFPCTTGFWITSLFRR